MATPGVEAVRGRLERVARAGLEPATYAHESVSVLGRAVPFDAACHGSLDPGTGLITGSTKITLPSDHDAEFLAHEYVTDEVNLFVDLARRPRPVGVLVDDTGGDPNRSTRYRDLLTTRYGLDHELRAALVVGGAAWATLALYRQGPRGFSAAEADLVAAVAPVLALGARAAVAAGAAQRLQQAPPAAAAGGGQAGEDGAPGVLVVDSAGRVVQSTTTAEHLVAELGGAVHGELPIAVVATIAAARAPARRGRHLQARARVRTRTGRWLVVHGAALADHAGDRRHVVVTIKQAGPPEVVPVVVAALGLSARERDVVAGVLRGASTAEIAAALHLSPYTVQDHLKSVFDKAGVSSRRELVAKVFFDQYAPRLGGALSPSGWFAPPSAR
ncbi:helix-turn-helix domain-containing protein [Georgenia yuyongxinii]|uniref:Helix-turn-helix transcriptional regulator n=1 Tax=Georgenia yuyongxinii TaxID=2589797 RepID=A0A552WWV9_9MICO|nr:helix-turn-helix transcriptional regulator [Georgenia yuyongxinii]TRW47254.1 helix-turn-helix transcriptional regulator [Georgenia yuyongxinii]